MKKLILNGKQIRLLRKTEDAGFNFYTEVSGFLEENQDLPDEETAEIEIEDDDVYNDITSMVEEHLKDDSEDRPTEQEAIELRELIDQLNPPEEPAKEDAGTEEEK